MKIITVVAVLLFGAALGMVGASMPAKANPHCRNGNGITSCSGATSLHSKSGGPHSSKTQLVSIRCDPNSGDRLGQLGDAKASQDVDTCASTSAACAKRSLIGTETVPVITLRRTGRDAAAYEGNACVGLGQPQVTADLVRAHVTRLVPSASIGIAPKGRTLVNIQTILWVDSGTRQTLAPLTLLGRRVVVRLKLAHVHWDFGDRHADDTSDPGKSYDEANDPCRTRRCPDYYGHVYRHSGKRTITARATWQASFTVDGGAAIDIPGTVTGPATTAAITVDQARAILVPNPH